MLYGTSGASFGSVLSVSTMRFLELMVIFPFKEPQELNWNKPPRLKGSKSSSFFFQQQTSGFQAVFPSSVQPDLFLISALWLPFSKAGNLVFHL